MKTKRIKIYSFDELSTEAQKYALSNYEVETDFVWHDAEKTVKAFCKAFGVETSRNSWLECSLYSFDDCILQLSGVRLQKYLYNNFKDILYKGKYLKNGGMTNEKPKAFHRMRKVSEITSGPNKGKFSISYYSTVQKEAKNFNLTGVCYDENILDPIYNFLELRNADQSNIDFESLINECFESLKNSIQNEVDYLESDENKANELRENETEFLKSGAEFIL